MPDADDHPPNPTPLTAEVLAAQAGTTVERIGTLTDAGVLRPEASGGYDPRDLHRVRLIEAFEASGIPLDALVAGAQTGRIDFAGYHELHRDPGPPSSRTYAAFRSAVDPDGARLHVLYTALGLAEPSDATRLAVPEEAILTAWLGIVGAIGDGTHAVRVIRLYAEATRRASEAALEVYAEAAASLGPDAASVDLEAYADLLVPWTVAARALPDLAAWLTERHLRHAIDAFSVETTEQLLAAGGHVPTRDTAPPGIAFVDLTGFTRTTQELGDEAAARLSLRLGDLARAVTAEHGGRLVKLLGDGAMLHLPDARTALVTSAALLRSLSEAGLPGGHAGVHAGPVIEREGDVFGRTVNLAARLSDQAPDGEIYVTGDFVASLEGSGVGFEAVGTADLPGIGPIALHRVEVASVSR